MGCVLFSQRRTGSVCVRFFRGCVIEMSIVLWAERKTVKKEIEREREVERTEQTGVHFQGVPSPSICKKGEIERGRGLSVQGAFPSSAFISPR